jgi:hypothetical protein
MDRDEMSNFNRGPVIDASYQVSVHLAKRFQRRRLKKSANQKQELNPESHVKLVIFILHFLAFVVTVNFSHFNLLL